MIPSETPGVTITRWDPPADRADGWRYFEWTDEDDDDGEASLDDGRLVVSCEHAILPLAELARFKAGEGPPEPPIGAGDRVRNRRYGEGTVIAVHDDSATTWVDFDGHAIPLVVRLSSLSRVDP